MKTSILERLISRKLWLTIATALVTALWPDIDLELKGQIIAGVGVVYVIVQGVVDALKR